MFYNGAMALDRDLAVAVGDSWARSGRGSLRGWDMLAATGARGLRLLNETVAFRQMVLTERQPEVLSVLRANARPLETRGARVYAHDARELLDAESFDYVDLDPFGTPVPFLPAALAALRVPGFLAVTATDMPVLAGVERGAAERRYGGRPIRGRLGPESGLRLLLAYLDRILRAHDLEMTPLLSYVLGHHVRAYVSVKEPKNGLRPEYWIGRIDPAKWDGPALRGSGPFGPLWLGPLFDTELVASLHTPSHAARPSEIRALVERLHEEVRVDRPFYYEPNVLAAGLRLTEPPGLDRIIEGLRLRGEQAVRTHMRPSGFRTTAPRPVVEEVAREISSGLNPRRPESGRSSAPPSESR